LKLGTRLKQIETLVSPGYQHIWDCCCDHGLLGASLIAKQAAPHIHLVDIVPELIETLSIKFQTLFPAKPNNQTDGENYCENHCQWHSHCLDIAHLPLKDHQGKHLVIIAGIGGELMTELVAEIIKNNPELALDFILCPVRQVTTLRQQLIELEMELKDEVLIKENNRFYEILFVSSEKPVKQPISSIGETIWQSNSPEKKHVAKEYLQQTINHYQRMQQGSNDPNLERLIRSYKKKSDLFQ